MTIHQRNFLAGGVKCHWRRTNRGCSVTWLCSFIWFLLFSIVNQPPGSQKFHSFAYCIDYTSCPLVWAMKATLIPHGWLVKPLVGRGTFFRIQRGDRPIVKRLGWSMINRLHPTRESYSLLVSIPNCVFWKDQRTVHVNCLQPTRECLSLLILIARQVDGYFDGGCMIFFFLSFVLLLFALQTSLLGWFSSVVLRIASFLQSLLSSSCMLCGWAWHSG